MGDLEENSISAESCNIFEIIDYIIRLFQEEIKVKNKNIKKNIEQFEFQNIVVFKNEEKIK